MNIFIVSMLYVFMKNTDSLSGMNKFQFDLKKALFKTRLGIAEHRQFNILEAALSMIQEEGFEQLQFGDLAKKCKISRTLVHHYFPTKIDLASRLLDLSTVLLSKYVENAIAQEKNKVRHFEVYCRSTLQWAAENPREAIGLMLFIYISSHNLEIRRRNDQLSALGRERIKTFISQMPDCTQQLELKADVIQTVLTGCYVRLLSENLDISESQKLQVRCLDNCISIAVS